ncbi:MAG TPA: efflux RND transporter periplasmic adaptor subunit, partial [Polyangiaceae bacterium]
QQARTLLNAANVGLKSAELDYQRTRELHQRGSVPQATFDQMQARYDNAKNAVAQAQVALSMAQRASADTVVTSPIDGVVTAKLKNVGETVTMMPPTVVLVVQNVKVLELRTRLPERNLAVLSPGTRLVVSFPALKIERTVDVARINPAVDALTRTVEIVARLDNADGRLKPGMLAEVRLASEVAAGAPGASGSAGTPPAPAASGAPASSGAVRNVATRKTP